MYFYNSKIEDSILSVSSLFTVPKSLSSWRTLKLNSLKIKHFGPIPESDLVKELEKLECKKAAICVKKFIEDKKRKKK